MQGNIGRAVGIHSYGVCAAQNVSVVFHGGQKAGDLNLIQADFFGFHVFSPFVRIGLREFKFDILNHVTL